ncbi:MAG: VWA domain-containing protein [Acidobacteria bacterium]|nr:VWA domain-containing protein [Acidobacteriota bacterium]
MRSAKKALLITALAVLLAGMAVGQSRHSVRGGDLEGVIVNVTAWRTDDKKEPITAESFFLYENGVEQRIRNFAYDPSPARIVLLVDNSQTVPADIEKLQKAVMEFAYEIFDGDQLFVVAYDEKPEIIQEWTDSAEKLEASLKSFRKQGNPNLFDAMSATVREVLLPLMPGSRKTVVVVIGDGLDRGSKVSFEDMFAEVQSQNITVYALQVPDRTGGAYRGGKPKAGAVITQLTEGTGGLAFPLDEAQQAAKFICDELRKNRYLLSYIPVNTTSFDNRRLLVLANEGIAIRTKNAQPPTLK